MISMPLSLRKAAGVYAKQTGRKLSGVIGESLEEKIKRDAFLRNPTEIDHAASAKINE